MMINEHNLDSQTYSSSNHYSINHNKNQSGNSKSGNKRHARVADSSQMQSNDHIYHDRQRQDSNSNDYADRYAANENMKIEIIPQDDNWGANTTAVTGDFSDFNDDMTEDGRSFHNKKGSNLMIDLESRSVQTNYNKSGECSLFFMYLKNYFGFICSMIVFLCAFFTPILFILLPRLNIYNEWNVTDCGLECEGLLIGIAFKLFILLIGSWTVFARKPTAFLPRIFELKAVLILLLCIMNLSFWLFYVVRIIFTQLQDYHKILQFVASYVDVLLFIYILSIIIVKMRPLQPEFIVNITRSPDGEQSAHIIGKMSIQSASIWILEQYYKDFKVYNPWLENIYRKRGVQQLKGKLSRQASKNNGRSDNDDNENDATSLRSKKSNRLRGSESMVGGNYSANDRFYEEYEFERRLRKRRARLLTTTEDAFSHIKRNHGDAGSISNFENRNSNMDNSNIPSKAMDPHEAAQAIFTSIARDLRRYLRVTRQQPYFTRESIVAHLANCISYDMSPKSFLQRYLNDEPIVFNEQLQKNKDNNNDRRQSQASSGLSSHGVNYHLNIKTADQSWILICDTPLYQNLEDNIMFVLKQNEVCLMCTFKKLPRFNLVEDILDPKRNKFVLKLNSETTV